MRRTFLLAAIAALGVLGACSDNPVGQDKPDPNCPQPSAQGTLGLGCVAERYTGELNVRGSYAYTTTWGHRGTIAGNAVKVWRVSGRYPQLVDSAIIEGATTTGDVQVSDDGSILAVATERAGGSLALFSLADPAHPTPIARYHTDNTEPGVHTATLARVGGKLYGFLCIDPNPGVPARLVIVDLSNPAAPVEVKALTIGTPYVHDVYVRDGLLFTGEWTDGVGIWDIGGGGQGGSPANPVRLSLTPTVGGHVHNIWWYHDAQGGKRYAFIGEESPGSVGASSSGDIHVLDVSDLTHPREVAFYYVSFAGTHNFSMDEANGILYAAYYNAGVRAIDVRGDLSACPPEDKSADGRCSLQAIGREKGRALDQGDLPIATYVWGVQYDAGRLFASDMLNGLVHLDPAHLK
jgi:hypothetical protein